MNEHTSRGFWITNHLANPVLKALLRSAAGRRMGRHLAVLRYRGRRTGQQHELVVQYARDGQHVWVMPGQPDRKNWWRNLGEPSTIEARLAGHDYHGRAVALDGREYPDDVQRGLTFYLHELPRARKALGFPANPGTDQETDLADAAKRAVIVRIDLDTGS
jgi:F420H(2)-dependent quinone reductase